jgi:sugar-specific transcriptional regulator TrmB
MQISTLRGLGLSDSEAKVYLVLVKTGGSFAGELSQKAGVNRTNSYDSISRLIEKGLVSFVILDGKKFFSPTSPLRLKELLVEKQLALDNELPSLVKEYNSSKEIEQATVFKGRSGIKSSLEEVLRENKPIFVFGAESRFADLFPVYMRQWNAKRVLNNSSLKIIYNENVRSQKKEKLGLIDIRYASEENLSPSTTMICGDLTLIIAWGPMFVFHIRSKEVSKSNLTFFNMIWSLAKK